MTPNAWKWPALWPYTPDYFDRPDESEDEQAFASARMTPCLEGSSREALVSHYARFLTEGAEILEIGDWLALRLQERDSVAERTHGRAKIEIILDGDVLREGLGL